MPNPVTSRDVARVARVSQSTVSRVMNNVSTVRPDARRRVEIAMATLGYVPNNHARSLITGRTGLLGLIVSNITNGFYPEIIEAITSTALDEGFTVIVGSAGERVASQAAYLQRLAEQRVDGAILTSTLPSDGAEIEALAASGLAIVLANRVPAGTALDSVSLDNVGAGRLVTSHLLGHGRRRIAYVGGRPEASTDQGRFAGYRAALREARVAEDDALISHDEFTADSGRRQTARLIATGDVDAIFAADDTVALGCLDAIADAGLRVPDDVAVIGIDDIAASRLRHISLTTISSAAHAMGTRALQLLVARIAEGDTTPPRHIEIEPTLILRGSCGNHS